jgi:hypothetical protein
VTEPAASVVARRTRQELPLLTELRQRIESTWSRYEASHDVMALNSLALDLHGWYSGFERLFQLIAADVDGAQPSGPSWHRDVLLQMAVDVPGVREAVLVRDVVARLQPFLGFRHVVRSAYSFELDPRRMALLVSDIGPLHDELANRLLAFADVLDAL